MPPMAPPERPPGHRRRPVRVRGAARGHAVGMRRVLAAVGRRSG
ncbi:hypothetical protein SXIM_14830 [Streptomyces xiamenensis]|uniref:Uncharacterized protein n=1 Tax=Streptomyces xiamenensis TaxID=408015 RepID=A0A0F7FS76_9ACTN|nr:hypothetical protein SXIM_14830 [Streptomyces xiamenensis]